MIPPVLLVVLRPLLPYLLAGAALLALLAGTYLSGARHARRADTAAAAMDRINTMEAGNAAASAYRDSGAAERLQRGSY